MLWGIFVVTCFGFQIRILNFSLLVWLEKERWNLDIEKDFSNYMVSVPLFYRWGDWEPETKRPVQGYPAGLRPVSLLEPWLHTCVFNPEYLAQASATVTPKAACKGIPFVNRHQFCFNMVQPLNSEFPLSFSAMKWRSPTGKGKGLRKTAGW